MANGSNEPVVFTRADSDRLARIEGKLDALNGFKKVFENYQNRHDKEHNKIDASLKDSISKKGVKWMLGIIGSLILIGSTIFAIVG